MRRRPRHIIALVVILYACIGAFLVIMVLHVIQPGPHVNAASGIAGIIFLAVLATLELFQWRCHRRVTRTDNDPRP